MGQPKLLVVQIHIVHQFKILKLVSACFCSLFSFTFLFWYRTERTLLTNSVQKLVNLDVIETSGVDRAAHLHDGFLVMKSVDESRKASLLEAMKKSKEDNLNLDEFEVEIRKAKEEFDAKTVELQSELEKAKKSEEDLKAKLDELQSANADEENSEKDGMPADVKKSLDALPSAERELLKSAFIAQMETLQKERDARADVDAIAKSREVYKNVGIDHETVAPALRRLSVIDPELAKAVDGVLAKAEAQISESGLLKEVGRSTTSTGSVFDEARSLAKALFDNGSVRTIELGIEKVLDSNPELAKRYNKEML